MDFGRVLTRAWQIIWDNKFLIVLGVLVALSSGSVGSNFGGGNGGGFQYQFEGDEFDFTGPPPPELEAAVPFVGLAAGVILVIICVLLIVSIIVWVISTIARGGLIASVNTIEAGEESNLSRAWRAGWERGRTLVGIGIIPAIPVFVLVIIGLGLTGALAGLSNLFSEQLATPTLTGFGLVMVIAACVALPLALVLGLLRTFAERAAMLENLGTVAAYGRGWEVLRTNLGSALLLFLIQIAIGIGLAILLIGPSIFIMLCCFLWPVLLVIEGTVAAYFSSVWTLAWREWTGPAELEAA